MTYHFLIFLMIQVSARLWLLYHFDASDIGKFDFRGLVGDSAVALLLTAIIHSLPRGARSAVFLALSGVLAICMIANAEVILATGNSIQFTQLHFVSDQTMLKGSMFDLTSATIPLTMLGIVVLAGFLEWRRKAQITSPGKPFWRRRPAVLTLIWLASCLLLYNALQKNFVIGAPYWRQFNLFVGNLNDALLMIQPPLERRAAAPEENEARLKQPSLESFTDLTGKSLLSGPAQQPNILLVVVEGLSGARMPGVKIRAKQDFQQLHSLEKVAKRGLTAKHFVSLNRQTNRGLFAIHCGQAPNLIHSAAKPDMYDPDRDDPCLPAILDQNGYTTIFLQGAWLEFMNKLRFANNAGFEVVLGAEHFPADQHTTGWGVNDKALFEKVEELAKTTEAPWFMSVLTVGTHHPYEVDEEFQSKFPENSLDRAIAFFDYQFSQLLERLEQQGLLENTLLIVTSDESAGIGDQVADVFAQQWLPLVAAGPSISPGLVNSDLFSSADIPLSVIDYLALESLPKTLFHGRSVFRTYEKDRTLVFGNTFFKTAGLFSDTTGMVRCSTQLTSCEKSTWIDPASPFSSAKTTTAKEAEIRYISEVIRRSDW